MKKKIYSILLLAGTTFACWASTDCPDQDGRDSVFEPKCLKFAERPGFSAMIDPYETTKARCQGYKYNMQCSVGTVFVKVKYEVWYAAGFECEGQLLESGTNDDQYTFLYLTSCDNPYPPQD